jgi:hypothetical protein
LQKAKRAVEDGVILFDCQSIIRKASIEIATSLTAPRNDSGWEGKGASGFESHPYWCIIAAKRYPPRLKLRRASRGKKGVA